MISVSPKVMGRLLSDLSDTALFTRYKNGWMFDLYVRVEGQGQRFSIRFPGDTPEFRLADCRRIIMDAIYDGKIRTMADLRKFACSVRDIARMKNNADKLALECSKGGTHNE